MKLIANSIGTVYELARLDIEFNEGERSNVFANKNNKTLQETLLHPRYAPLSGFIRSSYSRSLSEPLGTFLLSLKRDGDATYRRFLNKYGDGVYSEFRLINRTVGARAGIYAYCVGGALQYIGRCRDSMWKRINQGYGKIHPKNCFIDGQATNCHLNSRITPLRSEIELWFAELEPDEIVIAERSLISEYRPPWNIQRG